MSSSRKNRLAVQTIGARLAQGFVSFLKWTKGFFRRHWIGAIVILAATLIFFGPVIARIDSYSPGGDAMFNAWEMRRNQNCILRQNCPDYTDANIYYPNADTMLYSETQFSAGLVTLPLYWLNDNPIFAYNVLTIASFFLSGFFMYLLAKYLSRGAKWSEVFAVLAGLVFAFAPVKMAAIYHLQNLCIFCLPLAVLLILKFLDIYTLRGVSAAKSAAKTTKKSKKATTTEQSHAWRMWVTKARLRLYELPGKRYLVGLFLTLLYVFYASWVQMVFVLMAMGVLLLCALIFKLAKLKPLVIVFAVVSLAALATLPLATQYIRFSQGDHARFGLADQLMYSSDLVDYVIPHHDTLLGKAYYGVDQRAVTNSYNPDSYSYMGIVLYVTAAVLLVTAFRMRKRNEAAGRNYKFLVLFAIIAIIGFVVSLGPFLKIEGHFFFPQIAEDFKSVIPLPWLLVHELLPQLDFIRAIGRAAVLVLFALCCMLAFVPLYLQRVKVKKNMYIIVAVISALVVIELLPARQIAMATHERAYNLSIPPVYHYIKEHKEVDNIVILVSDYDYPMAPIPMARAEHVLWAGYHNKNIFNGYSGIEPKNYIRDKEDYDDFHADDIAKLKKIGIDYVLVDKVLFQSHPERIDRIDCILEEGKVYSDNAFNLYKLP